MGKGAAGKGANVVDVTEAGYSEAVRVTAEADRAFMEVHGSSDPAMREAIVAMYRAGLGEYRRLLAGEDPRMEDSG